MFSKFSVIKPFRRAESRSLVKFLENEIFLVYGVPNVIISDNRKHLVSNHFKSLLAEYHVHPFLNALYHPQNNPSERVNRVLLSSMRSYIGQDQRNFDEAILKIACAFRSAIHTSTKFTPY